MSATGAGALNNSEFDDSSRIGHVSYFPNLGKYATSINRETDVEEGPDFVSVEDAVAWISTRAPIGYVTLGSTKPTVFMIGETTETDTDDMEGSNPWPPRPEELQRLISDMESEYATAMAEESGEFPEKVVFERDNG